MDPKKYTTKKPKRYAANLTTDEAVEQLANAKYASVHQGDQKLATAHLMAMDALQATRMLCNRCKALTRGSTCMFCECRDLCRSAIK